MFANVGWGEMLLLLVVGLVVLGPERLPGAKGVRGIGMLYAFVLNEHKGRAVHLAARRRGLLIRPGHDFVVLAPPLVTTEAEADEIVAMLADAVSEVAG